jgi:hypothetical protein
MIEDSEPIPLDRHTPVNNLTLSDLRKAFRGALEDVLDDENRTAKFWRAGYEELTKHATTGATQWVGKRLVSAIGGALLAAGIWVGFKFGGWGK